MRTPRILLLLAAGAVVGFSIFGILVWRAVDVEEVTAADAAERFTEARSLFAGLAPILELDDHGRLVRRSRSAPEDAASPSSLRVLAYRAADRRLIRADVPFWFFELKGPAIKYAFAGTGLDMEQLGITAGDLKRYGPTLVIDLTRTDGDRLLVWTQ